MKYSIIIPVYNVEKYIKKCLESIKKQTYKNFEVIIVNDGSKQNEKEIIKPFLKDKRFKYYEKENGGLSDARNYGVGYATGDYIIYVDSDDYIEKDLLTKINNLVETTDYDVVRYNLNVVSEDGKIIFKNDDIDLTYDPIKSILLNKYVEPAWLYAYKKDFYLENKFTFPKGKIHEDFYLTLLILDKAKNVGIINYNGYNYVQRGTGIMGNKAYEKVKNRVEDFISHNKYHQKNIKNKYILSYSNRSIVYKISELKGKDLDNKINYIEKNKILSSIYSLNFKQFLINTYMKLFLRKFVYSKNNDFYKGE